MNYELDKVKNVTPKKHPKQDKILSSEPLTKTSSKNAAAEKTNNSPF